MCGNRSELEVGTALFWEVCAMDGGAQRQRWQRYLRILQAAQETAARQIGQVVHVDPGDNILQGAQYPAANWSGIWPGDWLCPCKLAVSAKEAQCPRCQAPRSSCLAVEPLRRGQRWCTDCGSLVCAQYGGECPGCGKPGQQWLPHEPAIGTEPPGPCLEIPDDYRSDERLVQWLRALLHGDGCCMPVAVWPRVYFIRQAGHEVRAIRCRDVGAAWNCAQPHVEDVLRNAQRNGELLFAHVCLDSEWAVVSLERPGRPHQWGCHGPEGRGGNSGRRGQVPQGGTEPGRRPDCEDRAQGWPHGRHQPSGGQGWTETCWHEAPLRQPREAGELAAAAQHGWPQEPDGPEALPGSWSVLCPDGLYICSECKRVQLGTNLSRNLDGTDFRCPLCQYKGKDGWCAHVDCVRALGEEGARIAEEATRWWEEHLAFRAKVEERNRLHEERSRTQTATVEARRGLCRGGSDPARRATEPGSSGAGTAQPASVAPACPMQPSAQQEGLAQVVTQPGHCDEGVAACGSQGHGGEAGVAPPPWPASDGQRRW